MKVLEHRLAPWFVLAIALALGLSTIQLGFYNDDYAIHAGLQGLWPNGPPVWDLYRFSYDGEAGNRAAIAHSDLPWWTAPALKLHLVRPLASLSFALDAKIFGTSSSVGWHLHSIAWYLLVVHLVGTVLRRVLPRATATIAMFVYAVSAAHFFSFGWIACRHMVIAAAFGLGGLAMLVRDQRRGPWVFAIGLAASLAGGETGIGIAVFGIVFMIAKTKREGLALRLAPTALVLVAWLGAYVALGGGAAHSDGYIDPTSAPARFASKAATMLPVMIGNALLGVPAEMVSVASPGSFVVVGVIAAVFAFLMWRGARDAMDADERSALPWLLAAAVLATAPSLGGFPGGRILLVPNVGFAALIAVLIRRGFVRTPHGSTIGRVNRAVGAGLLCFVHVVAAPLMNLGNASFNAKVARQLEAATATIDVENVPPGGVRLFVIGASDPLVTMYPPIVGIVTSPKFRERAHCWSVVSPTKSAHEMRRVGPNEIVVRPTSGRMLEGPFESLHRSKTDAFRVGDEVRQCNVVYRVTAVDQGKPTELDLTFDVPLEDPSLRILLWNGERFVPLAIPSVGETAQIAWSPGPLGMF